MRTKAKLSDLPHKKKKKKKKKEAKLSDHVVNELPN